MDNELLDLLRTCGGDSERNSEDYTHTSLYGPTREWSVLEMKHEQFWRKYCDLAQSPGNNPKRLCLAENPRKHMPVLVDLTFKFHPLETSEEPFGDGFVLSIIYCYQQVIKKTLKIDARCTQLICCVLKAETVVEDNLTVCHLRLQFPYCKTVAQLQSHLIRPLVLQMLRTTNAFARLESQPMNEWEDIIDPLSVEKPVTLYGSSTTPATPKYVLEYILPEIQKENITQERSIDNELENTFFAKNHEHIGNGTMSEECMLQVDEDDENEEAYLDHEYWLPFFLSIYYIREITLPKNDVPKENLNSSYGSSSKSSNNKKGYSFSEEEKDTPEYLATVFLGLLDKKRALEEHYWLIIGKALHSAFSADERGSEKWAQFTKTQWEGERDRSKMKTEEDCHNTYENFITTNYSIKTLAFYAREDNPKEYNKWHEAWCFKSLQNALSCTHADVADALYRVCWLEFACSKLSKTTFYQFRKGTWKKLDSGHSLKTYISREFISSLEKLRIDILMQVRGEVDKNTKDAAEVQVQKICTLITKLKNRSFKSNIFGECAERFYVEKFEESLDSNPEILGCVNCVLQVLEKKVVPRTGIPEDFVSRTSSCIFNFSMHEKHPCYLKLMSYLGKVFPDKELMHYFGKLIASSLKGRNSDKIFAVHSGRGNNSKSMIKKLVECVFGDYVISIPTSFFTNIKSGGPQPEIARSKYAHIAFFQEPDAEVPLRAGTIKELTGGDKFFARFLNSDGGEIAPMFTLHLMCNTIPPMSDSGPAMRNRVKIIPYLSSWSADAPKDTDQQYMERTFLLDPDFEKQLPEMAPAFLWWLVTKMYPEYCAEGIKETTLVKKYTSEYWSNNDPYTLFVSENLEKVYRKELNDQGKKVANADVILTLVNVYTRFRDWYGTNYKFNVPERSIFKNEMESRIGKSLNNKFIGWQLKVDLGED